MTGDYDQIGAVGQSEIKLNGESGLNMFETHRNNFMGGIKLGTSVRSNNDLKLIIYIKSENRMIIIINLKT